ncbi:unnamed protein product [Ranitomeya imitator]|uniref:Uncharacterized protein n=1 Tax=Ranitomeya imitator TaxID=111125 RepID=A0ABN9LEK4_9NEOB|nr:unnamed protein product [Ranitomeya imitator]
MHLLENDLNPEVRRAVLSCIAPSARTLPKIVGRTKDVKELVRKLAYQVLAEKVHIRALTIAQRVSLLQLGLNDRSEAVKDIMQKKLLQSWLKYTEGNVLELLHRLDVENSPEVAVSALNAMFALSSVSELVEKCKNIDESAAEAGVLVWRRCGVVRRCYVGTAALRRDPALGLWICGAAALSGAVALCRATLWRSYAAAWSGGARR